MRRPARGRLPAAVAIPALLVACGGGGGTRSPEELRTESRTICREAEAESRLPLARECTEG